jgi:lipopolysaccharide/colanic/teichoic acid biosynthesis glycosyltransferase
MISPAAATRPHPTLWGLTPTQLHDRFWAARGVQVVRQGEPSDIVAHAELFLLTEPRTLALFKLTLPVEYLSWIKPDVLAVRLHDERERGYKEHVATAQDGRFERFERVYGGTDSRLARVALTPDPKIAQLWQKSPSVREAWRAIRGEVPRSHRGVMSLSGMVFDRCADAEVMQFMRELMRGWRQPDATVNRVAPLRGEVWRDESAAVADASKLVGTVWIGAGRNVGADANIVGPQVLWDDPNRRPAVEAVQWQEIEPSVDFVRPVKPGMTSIGRAFKRGFDILFATLAILFTLPLYPFIMLAIWLEDGWPVFFAQKRETMGGREFGCLKFRSMRRDAERIKKELMAQNQADGPQFYIDNDPRILAVGRFLRKTYLDELPQFWNVLLGHMSVVGPRPSPRKENQYCPPWREARLSVRPGVTGLWQVRRTRRAGRDFQEWIRYDIEYVEKFSWWLDVKIILETVRLVIRGVIRS